MRRGPPFRFLSPDERADLAGDALHGRERQLGVERQREHLAAQRLGRERFYELYELRITEVTRAYEWHRAARIFHVALPGDWNIAQRAGEYTMSTRGRSLVEEGFIHCSFADQVEAIANRYYADLDDLVLLTVDPARLGSELVVEDPFSGAPQRFPHVYAPIPVAAVVDSTAWQRQPDQPWVVPA